MTTSVALEVATFVTGCILFRRSWRPPYKWLLLLVGLNVFVEFFSNAWSKYTGKSNHWMYNSYWPIQSAVLMLIFYSCTVHPKVRRYQGWLLALLPVLLLASWLKAPFFFEINIVALQSCDLLLLLSACGAITDVVLDIEHGTLLRQPLFWLACGALIYSADFVVFYSAFEYHKKMLFTDFFNALYFSSYNLFFIGIAGCFVCAYMMGLTQKESK